MRVSAERKAETRHRILDAASRLFREHGVDAVGVDAIMRAAGLTHGGFYAHFASKEALVAEVAVFALARSADRWENASQTPDRSSALARIVEPYLDLAHVAARDRGCMLPAIGPDLARRQDAQPAISSELRRMLAALQRCLPDTDPLRAKAVLACMVGAMLLARLTDDPALACGFLDAAKRAVTAGKGEPSPAD